MTARLSPRLREILEALPLSPGMRVLEIGCGPGALARGIAERVGDGFVLGIDRSAAAIRQAREAAATEVATGRLALRCVAVEDFELGAGEEPFDLAVAVRVGALDGRHPGDAALRRIAAALTERGTLYVDVGSPLWAVPLGAYRGERNPGDAG